METQASEINKLWLIHVKNAQHDTPSTYACVHKDMNMRKSPRILNDCAGSTWNVRFITTNSTDDSSGIQSCFFDGEVKYSGSQFTAWTTADYVLHTTLESSCMRLHQCRSKVALSNATMHTELQPYSCFYSKCHWRCSETDLFSLWQVSWYSFLTILFTSYLPTGILPRIYLSFTYLRNVSRKT